MGTREGVLPALPSNYSLSICYYTGGMKMHAVIIRSILWGFRLFHLTPLVAIYLLQIGKWPAAIIAAVWPVWLVGLLLFELEILRKWLKPVLTAEERVLLRDSEAGDARAQFRLGKIHDRGNEGFYSSEIHSDAAIRWYRKAAHQGHAEAAFRLAEILMDRSLEGGSWSDGTPPHPDDPIPEYRRQRMINGAMHDRVEAARYYRIAADHGHALAQGRIGELCRTGNAVPKNLKAAHMWLSLALAGMAAEADGTAWPARKRVQQPQDTELEEMLADYHGFAAALAELEKTMTPAQIRQAKARVAGWENTGNEYG